ncbi:hypothetical protein K523DRAFT_322980 [Schizophyllum commune Tattone D]|nr:hypothetical protein K523DRAFT_322980 [Schizophyllum commune Tattone D]
MLSFSFAVLALQACAALATPTKRDAVAYVDPTKGGGSMLDDAGAGNGGEPLNVIVSGLSSPDVLTDDGIVNYARAIGFSTECFGLHGGGAQSANLGDGNGWVNQTFEVRQDYGSSGVGTCLETLIGGNHFRVFRQNGTQANTGALFLAVSQEEDLSHHHTISPDGYNVGRDKLVAAAVGDTSFNDVSYTTTAENVTGLLPTGADGINHGIALDGIVTVLTIEITS